MRPASPWWQRIHAPTAALLAVTVVCATASPVAFFAFVPERIIDRVLGLPWLTILEVGVPALIAAGTTLGLAFSRGLIRPKDGAP